MGRELLIKVNYCSECPAFREDYDSFGTCGVSHFHISPSDQLTKKGVLGFPKDCPLQEVASVMERFISTTNHGEPWMSKHADGMWVRYEDQIAENTDLKNRLSCVSSQLEFLIRETKKLVEDSEKCLNKYGWNK